MTKNSPRYQLLPPAAEDLRPPNALVLPSCQSTVSSLSSLPNTNVLIALSITSIIAMMFDTMPPFPTPIGQIIENPNPAHPNIIDANVVSWFNNATHLHIDMSLDDVNSVQCNHGNADAHADRIHNTTPNLTTYTDDSLVIYATTNNVTAPIIIVAQGPYGIPQDDADYLLDYFEHWNMSSFRPKAPANDNRRYVTRRPIGNQPTHGLFNGGLWRPYNSQSYVPELTADVRAATIPYINYMHNYRARGVSRRMGQFRYLLNPDGYDTGVAIYNALPTELQPFVVPDDGAITHIFNFNFYADCHKDTKNRGVTTQVKYGRDNSYLCFPALTLKIQLRHGSIVTFLDSKNEHYVAVDTDPQGVPIAPTLPRYLHTSHVPVSVLTSYMNHRANWYALTNLWNNPPNTIFDHINALHT